MGKGRQSANEYLCQRVGSTVRKRGVERKNEMPFGKEGGGVRGCVSDEVAVNRNRIPLGLQRHIL